MLPENRAAASVVDAAFKIHSAWGPGLLESAYARALHLELVARGHRVQREVRLPVVWRGQEIEDAFRLDFVVDGRLILELKALEGLHPVHQRQVITYLKLSGLRLALLINFGEARIKTGITRIVNGLP